MPRLATHARALLARTLAPVLLALAAGCASLPPNTDRSESLAYRDTADTLLGRGVAAQTARHSGLSGFHLLPDGHDAFVARAALAALAERSIDAQYYLLHDDLVGRLFLHALIEAADRGVRVRLLVDDMALQGKDDFAAGALDAHPNVELRIFNPFSRGTSRALQLITRFGDVTRRMHNKSFTVDNQVGVIGGRNIGNEYYAANPHLAFGDLDVIAIGPVVDEVSAVFDRYWNNAAAYPVTTLVGKPAAPGALARFRRALSDYVAGQRDSGYLRALRESQLAQALRARNVEYDWADAAVVFDDPEKIVAERSRDELKLVTRLQSRIERIDSELIIFSPYFVPGKAGVARLRELRERGVRVRILTNSLASTDVGAVHAGYARYRKPLLAAGVELYEIDKVLTRAQRKGSGGSQKASLHAKSFVMDRKRVFIGSLNLDPRSVVENTEIGLVIESAAMAARMAGWFERIARDQAFRLELETGSNRTESIVWQRTIDGVTNRYTTEPNTGFWRRFGVNLLKLMPIESQL